MSFAFLLSVKRYTQWIFSLSYLHKIILFVLFALFLGSVVKSFYYTSHYGGCDLRIRVVGSRLLATDHSPYFYKWSPGDPETLLNPVHLGYAANGVSVAPGSLYVQYVFHSLDYKSIRFLWTIFQYVLALYILLYFLTKSFEKQSSRIYAALITVIFFFCSDIWFINIERGQIYILYAFLFCIVYQFYSNKQPWSQFAAAAVLAIAVYCRPTFAVVAIPFIPKLNRHLVYGFVISSAILLLVVFLNLHLWRDYFSAMAIYTGFHSSSQNFSSDNAIIYPAVIEGCKNLFLYKQSFSGDGIYPIFHYFRNYHLSKWFYVALYLVIAALLIFLFRKTLSKFNSEKTILFGFLLYILTEYFIPASRGGYNVVQWIFPVLLILKTTKFDEPDFIFLIAGLCLMVSFPYNLPFFHDIGEVALVYCLFRFLRKEETAKSADAMSEYGLSD
jgi:hypothetical protein